MEKLIHILRRGIFDTVHNGGNLLDGYVESAKETDLQVMLHFWGVEIEIWWIFFILLAEFFLLFDSVESLEREIVFDKIVMEIILVIAGILRHQNMLSLPDTNMKVSFFKRQPLDHLQSLNYILLWPKFIA